MGNAFPKNILLLFAFFIIGDCALYSEEPIAHETIGAYVPQGVNPYHKVVLKRVKFIDAIDSTLSNYIIPKFRDNCISTDYFCIIEERPEGYVDFTFESDLATIKESYPTIRGYNYDFIYPIFYAGKDFNLCDSVYSDKRRSILLRKPEYLELTFYDPPLLRFKKDGHKLVKVVDEIDYDKMEKIRNHPLYRRCTPPDSIRVTLPIYKLDSIKLYDIANIHTRHRW